MTRIVQTHATLGGFFDLFRRKKPAPPEQNAALAQAAGATMASGFQATTGAAGAAAPFASLYTPALESGTQAGMAQQSTTPWLAAFTSSFSDALDSWRVPQQSAVPQVQVTPESAAAVPTAPGQPQGVQLRTFAMIAGAGTLLFVTLALGAAFLVSATSGRRRRR